jgi:hypothetical protein
MPDFFDSSALLIPSSMRRESKTRMTASNCLIRLRAVAYAASNTGSPSRARRSFSASVCIFTYPSVTFVTHEVNSNIS